MKKLVLLFGLLTAAASCNSDDDRAPQLSDPEIALLPGTAQETSYTFTIESDRSGIYACSVFEKAESPDQKPSAEEIFRGG